MNNQQTLNKKPTIYMDMDGVVVRYNYAMYETPEGVIPAYKKPAAHCYRDLKPDTTAVAIFKYLYNNTALYTKILTGLGCPYLISEHLQDKLWWCHDVMDPFSSTDFLCVYGSKVDAVTHLKQLSPYDILIDDFNPNLDDWRKAGGTSVKYVNNINSPRSDLFNLYSTHTPAANIHNLLHYLERIGVYKIPSYDTKGESI